jgi:tetrahydromethanopterin S-methyltransferase subunit F
MVESKVHVGARNEGAESGANSTGNKAEVAALDREWEDRCAGYMIRSRDGRLIEPNMSQAITYLLGILLLIVLVVIPLVTSGSAASTIGTITFWLMGICVVVFVGLAAQRYSHYRKYVAARRIYLERRNALTGQQ